MHRTEATFLAHVRKQQREATRSRLTRGRLCSKEERHIKPCPPSGRIRFPQCSGLLLRLVVRADIVGIMLEGSRRTMRRRRRSAVSRRMAYEQAVRLQRELVDVRPIPSER